MRTLDRKNSGCYLTSSEVCELLCISKATLWRYTKYRPEFPKPIFLNKKKGGKMIYKKSEILKFVESC